jgi:hypothetical protein
MPEHNRSCEVRARRHNLGMLRRVLLSRRKGSFPLQEGPRGRTPRRRYQADQFYGAVPYHHREQWRGSPEEAAESGPFTRCLLQFSVGQRFRLGKTCGEYREAWEKHLRAERNRKADIHTDNTDNTDDKRPIVQDDKRAYLSESES